MWESNERPSSNPVAKQPKCYAEGISLKLESKHRSELVNQAQAGGCTPTLQRGQVGGFAELKEERRERQRENAADLWSFFHKKKRQWLSRHRFGGEI